MNTCMPKSPLDISLVRFLQDNGACTTYSNNMTIEQDCLVKTVEPKNWINFAFKWEDTTEGKEYWQELDKKWLEYVNTTYYNITFGDLSEC